MPDTQSKEGKETGHETTEEPVDSFRHKLFEKAARRAGGVEELEREVFRTAAGGEEGCRLVRDQHFIKELVDTLGSWIEAQDLGPGPERGG